MRVIGVPRSATTAARSTSTATIKAPRSTSPTRSPRRTGPPRRRSSCAAALAIDPGFVEAWYNLAGFLDAAADRAGAKESLDKALAIDGEYADALYNLGQLHFEDGDYDRALECWERYLRFDPQSEWGEKARRAMAVCRRRAKPSCRP